MAKGWGVVLVLCAVAATATTDACGTAWELVDGLCLYKGLNKGWHDARASCEKVGGYFAVPLSEKHVNWMREHGGGWVGLFKKRSLWSYVDESVLPQRAPDEYRPSGSSSAPCGYVSSMGVFDSKKCTEEKSYFCMKGWNGCVLPESTIVFQGARKKTFRIEGSVIYETEGALRHAMGVGKWEGVTSFVAKENSICEDGSPFAVEVEDGSTVTSLCQGMGMDIQGGDPTVPTPHPDDMRHTGQVESLSCRDNAPIPPVPTSPWSRVAMVSPFDGSTKLDKVVPHGIISTHETERNMPSWAWPLTYLSVAMASAALGIGVVSRNIRRRGKKAAMAAQSDYPTMAASPPVHTCSADVEMNRMEQPPADRHEGSQDTRSVTADTCEVCKKFNESTVRSRLVQAHQLLSRELSMPLVVNSIRFSHEGGDHVHVFNVANQYDAHTLGALSTVYSRTKPRLPRNTRIHIVHENERALMEQGSNFAADHDYISAQYY